MEQIKILTIDDEEPVRRCFKKYLERQGFNIVEADSGLEGLKVFHAEQPDLVLVDLCMPEMDGMEVLKKVKADSPDTPIVIISGKGAISDAMDAVRLGAADYLLKPVIDLSLLTYTIQRALEKTRLIRENREYQEHLEELVNKRTEELQELNIQLGESEYKFRSLYEHANDAILLIDNDDFIDCNQKTLKLFRATKEEIIGHDLMAFSPEAQPGGENSASKAETMIRKTLAGNPQFFEWEFHLKEGQIFFAEVGLSCISLKNERIILAIIRDITRRKQAEEEILQMNEALEQRVRERTEALELSMENLKRTQQQLVESEKMSSLGALVAGVAHEINTPIGLGLTDASFLEEITREFETLYSEGKLTKTALEKYADRAKQTSKSIFANLNRAAELITSFKQVAADRSSEAHRRFKVKDYLESILQSLHGKLKRTKHTIRIECSSSLEIRSFPGALSQIITNFIMNSLIHGFEGIEQGECVIEVLTEQSSIILKYSDNGIGMSENTVKHIFDPFFTTKRSLGGTGLGMHIVYNLVTQTLGGTIRCTSEPGKGARFLITFPIEEEPNNGKQ